MGKERKGKARQRKRYIQRDTQRINKVRKIQRQRENKPGKKLEKRKDRERLIQRDNQRIKWVRERGMYRKIHRKIKRETQRRRDRGREKERKGKIEEIYTEKYRN